jgi:hypothetical protein
MNYFAFKHPSQFNSVSFCRLTHGRHVGERGQERVSGFAMPLLILPKGHFSYIDSDHSL